MKRCQRPGRPTATTNRCWRSCLLSMTEGEAGGPTFFRYIQTVSGLLLCTYYSPFLLICKLYWPYWKTSSPKQLEVVFNELLLSHFFFWRPWNRRAEGHVGAHRRLRASRAAPPGRNKPLVDRANVASSTYKWGMPKLFSAKKIPTAAFLRGAEPKFVHF